MVNRYSLKKNGNDKISDNFILKEFACKDGSDDIVIDSDLINVIQNIRNFIKKPIKIISGYRTEHYNIMCGGASNSFHTKGLAADITADYDINLLAVLAAVYGCRGIIIYKKQNFVHVDMRPNLYISQGE